MTRLDTDPTATPTTTHVAGYKCGPGFGTRGETAYNLRVSGLSWDAIAERLLPPSLGVEGGDPASAMTNLAKKYAASQKPKLPWPVKAPKAPKAPKAAGPSGTDLIRAQQEKAYSLRVSGLSWAEAARLAQYKHTSHAVTGAGKHASRNGLAWPIKLA